MERQLILIDEHQPDWRLDEHTREVGRAGVAKARTALREAVARSTERSAHGTAQRRTAA
jgi:hypothetical protein